jgi:hypothetical protein
MTYQEFKNKYNEQYIDYDGSYGCQCWDLAQFYFTQVLNVPDSVLSGCGWVGNMVLWDWKYAELMEYFDEVSTIDMQQGDVCIWANPDNEQNCHIAIFDYYNRDDNNCYYFSQNPNPCRVMVVNMEGHHCFRRKKETPPAPPEPTPVITPNVERDETRDQIEVLPDTKELRVRNLPGLDEEIIGYANPGFYNYFETVEKDDYTWYRISDNNWIAYSDEWEKVYPGKPKEEFIQLKVLDKKDGYVLVDLGQVWIKE